MIKINKIYIAFLTAGFIFAYMEGEKLSYSIFCSMVFFIIAAAIDIIMHARGISVRVDFDKQIHETGDSAQISMLIHNKSLLPASVVVVKNSVYSDFSPNYNGHALSLGIFKTKELKLDLGFVKRGVYNFGNASLNIKDFFSIFELHKNINEQKTVKVYPRIYTLKNVVTAGNENFETLLNRKGNMEDMSTIDDIRKYRLGDSLRRIHWKVSAKHGELYTKNFQTFSGEECNLFLDMNKSGYFIDNADIIEEQLVDLFCSVADHMRCKGVKSSIYISSDDIKKFEVKSKGDMDELKEFFLFNYSTGDGSFVKFIESTSRKIEGCWLGVFVPRITMRIKKAVQTLKYKGYNVSVFFISADSESIQYMQQLRNIGVECLSFNEAV